MNQNLIYLFGNQENRDNINETKINLAFFVKTMELSAPCDICHNRFKRRLLRRKDRPLFQGMEIYVPLKWIESGRQK